MRSVVRGGCGGGGGPPVRPYLELQLLLQLFTLLRPLLLRLQMVQVSRWAASCATLEEVIISQPIFRFLGVIFDGDHDFEGLRSPRAHLDTVLRNLLSHSRPPRRGSTV